LYAAKKGRMRSGWFIPKSGNIKFIPIPSSVKYAIPNGIQYEKRCPKLPWITKSFVKIYPGTNSNKVKLTTCKSREPLFKNTVRFINSSNTLRIVIFLNTVSTE
jgi:hypothetical protein